MNKNIFSIDDKIIVVTGASGLLGRYHVEAIAAFGGIPILIDIDNNISNISKEINDKYKIESSSYLVDITSESSIEKNCKEILKKYGKIDGLINNAANNPKIDDDSRDLFCRLENFKLSNWEKDLKVGLTGAFLCSKHYGTAISSNVDGGTIINISSDLGLIGPNQSLYAKKNISIDKQIVKPVTYSVVKTGIIGLTRYLATYWPNKVRANALCPGGVNFNYTKGIPF